MRVTFLSPRLPPRICGVGDHTRCLALAMAGHGVQVGFVHRGTQPVLDMPEGPVRSWDGGVKSLVRAVEEQAPDWLWVQVSGYGYSRWGAPARLGWALSSVRKKWTRVRIAVCLHETHCRVAQLGMKGPLLAPWQRHTVGAVARLGDQVFATTSRYRAEAVAAYGVDPAKASVLPVGSNIPIRALSPPERLTHRRRLGWGTEEVVAIAFGSYPTQLAALTAFEEKLREGFEKGALNRVVCVGGFTRTVPNAFAARRQRLGRPLLDVLGPRPASDVAIVLSCADVGLCATPREALDKSGSFKAFGLAGLAVLVLSGPKTKLPRQEDFDAPEPLPVLLADTWDWADLSSRRVQVLRRELRARVSAQCSWDALARVALERMHFVGRRSAPCSPPVTSSAP
jgi:hypothetical protein